MKGVILIGGAPSSGSTLLVNLLAKQPKLLCLPETGLFSHGRNLIDLTAPVERRSDLGWHLPWLLTAYKVAGALGWEISVYEQAGRHHRTAFDLLEAHIDRGRDRILVEKTPENVFAFREYLSMSADHRVIVTSRDLLGVVQSLVRRDFNLVEAFLAWFSHTFETVMLLADFPNQVFHCRYAELTSSPDKVIGQILDFLPLEPEQRYDDSEQREPNGGIETLLDVSAWKLTDTAWSRSPNDAPRANQSPNLLGLDFDMLKRLLLFRPASYGLCSLAALEDALENNRAPVFLDEVEGVAAVCELTSNMTRTLALHYAPHLRKI